MNIQGFIDSAIAFSRDNPIVAAVVGLALLVFMVRKTKLFFGLVLLGLLLAGLYFTIMQMAGGGAGTKSRLIEKGASQNVK